MQCYVTIYRGSTTLYLIQLVNSREQIKINDNHSVSTNV